ncbi:MAG: hypothetical protein GY950_05560 [bacterium]|nr:hypothetical protein [bacterium]
MKQKRMKLTFKKETISNLELEKTTGGVYYTYDYSQCGTGPATIVPCMCPNTYYCPIKTS